MAQPIRAVVWKTAAEGGGEDAVIVQYEDGTSDTRPGTESDALRAASEAFGIHTSTVHGAGRTRFVPGASLVAPTT